MKCGCCLAFILGGGNTRGQAAARQVTARFLVAEHVRNCFGPPTLYCSLPSTEGCRGTASPLLESASGDSKPFCCSKLLPGKDQQLLLPSLGPPHVLDPQDICTEHRLCLLPFRFPGLSSGLREGLVVACSGDGFLVVAVWRVWTSHCCAVPSWASLRLKCLCLTHCLLCSLWSGF